MNETPCPFCTIDAQRIFYFGDLVVGVWEPFGHQHHNHQHKLSPRAWG